MAKVGLKINVDSATVRAMFRTAPDTMRGGIRSLLDTSGAVTMGIMRRRAPAGATGDLRKTTHYVFTNDKTVAVEPQASYALPVEQGTRPHWVSVREGTPLRRWANLKGIPPYALQRAIARHGTKAHPFMQPTFDEAQPVVKRLFDNGMMNLLERIQNG